MAKKTTTTSQRKKPLSDPFAKKEESPLMTKTEEGIDIVVPMLFPYAGTWIYDFKDACQKSGRKAELNERFRSWDLERYFFRGIAKFLPFVRKVHLILADSAQVPFWLRRDMVNIVLHKDIMPADVLPTFNSSTIEMWLHNIKGLSETFIYCNDDMIATAPMTAEDFFVDGKPVTRCKKKTQPISGEFLHTVKNCLDMAGADNGVTFEDNVLLRDTHSYSPMLLSTIREVVSRHGDEIHRSCTPFRADTNLCQYLYTYEMWLAGKCHEGEHKHRYFDLGSPYLEIEQLILSEEAGIACFNDAGIGSWTEMRSRLFTILQKILGDKCKYELI